jgi:ATP-dependent 26S proteasome regulatory subunit
MESSFSFSLHSIVQAAPVSEDLYARLKELESQIEFLDIQEEYVKTELKNLKRELIRSKQEIQRIRAVPLVIGKRVNHEFLSIHTLRSTKCIPICAELLDVTCFVLRCEASDLWLFLNLFQTALVFAGQFVEMVDATSAIIQSTSGSTSYVRVLSTLDREKLKANTSIVRRSFWLKYNVSQ